MAKRPKRTPARPAGTMARIGEWVRRHWDPLRDFLNVLKPIRFSVLWLLVGFLFLIVDQGQEVLRGLAEWRGRLSDELWRLAGFYCALLVWASHIWYWARSMLRVRYPGGFLAAPRYQRARIRAPRLLAAGAFAAVAVAFVRAYGLSADDVVGTRLLWLAAVTAALGAVFYILLVKRRDWQQRLYRAARGSAAVRTLRLGAAVELVRTDTDRGRAYAADLAALRELSAGPKTLLWTSFLLAAGLSLAFAWHPPWAAMIGAPAVVLLAGALWIPLGSMATYYGTRWQFPMLSFLVALALVFSFFNDNHSVRTLPGAAAERPALDAYLRDRFPAAPPKREPVFIVAAEGGGIRAAYWTAMTLTALQDRNPRFAERLAAVSGVSGGSLGAAVFDALLRESPPAGTVACPEAGSAAVPGLGPVQHCAHRVLSGDFLAPTLSVMLYSDLLQRFLPVSVPLFDRGRALELAWEAGWRDVMGNNRFGAPFHDLWTGEGARLPALLLNGTWVETGKRIVTTNVRLDTGAVADAVDLGDVLAAPIPLSTAAHNSSRFTYVSPAGTIRPAGGDAWGHVVDGGYFENSGGTTAAEVLRAVARTAPRAVPVVILITNDPQLYDPARPPADRWLNEVAAPLRALLNTRNARGSYSRRMLCEEVTRDHNGYFIRIALRPGEGPLPLGWTLSELAKDNMLAQLKEILGELRDPLDPRQLAQLARRNDANSAGPKRPEACERIGVIRGI